MSLFTSVMYFSLGFFISFIFPRLPIMLITRTKGFNTTFPAHPEPIPLSPKLTQRVLHMRMIYWMGFVAATIPLLFGLASIKWGNAAFGFGLWISSGWFILSRMQTFVGGPKPPWTLEMAQRLQLVLDEAKSESACCIKPSPEWKMLSISCNKCGKVLEKIPRPDLGRKRKDGFFAGGFRLLLTDGYPVIDNNLGDIEDSEE